MVKVLQVVHSMNQGGAETVLMDLYRNIDLNKVQFDFLLHLNSDSAFCKEIKLMGGKIFYISPRHEGVIKNKLELNSFFKENPSYNIVHQHCNSLSYIEPLATALRAGVKTRIVHGHSTREGGSKLHYFLHKGNQNIIKKVATHYFACSDLSANWMFGTKILKNNNNFAIINNGINLEKFKFNPDYRNMKRNEFGLNNKFVVGHVGRFINAKNHVFLLEIFKEITLLIKNAHLILIGDGELKEVIKNKIRGLKLETQVTLFGAQSDVNLYLQMMDVFIFPSIYEGFPVSLIEAQAEGVPCIVSANITKQAALGSKCIIKELSDSKKNWAMAATKFINLPRSDETDLIRKKGFDVKSIANGLQNFYMEQVKQ